MTLSSSSNAEDTQELEKTKLTLNKDVMLVTADNIESLSKFVGSRVEELNKGFYGFRRGEMSSRTYLGDYITKIEGKVEIHTPKNFKAEFDLVSV